MLSVVGILYIAKYIDVELWITAVASLIIIVIQCIFWAREPGWSRGENITLVQFL